MLKNSSQDRYYNLLELAEYSRLGKSTLRKYIKQRGLPAYKPDGLTLIRKAEFDTWMRAFRMRQQQDVEDIATEAVKAVRGAE